MLLLRLAHVLVHVLDEGVIRVRLLFASCAHNIARLGECNEVNKESCLVVRRRGSRFALKVQR